MTRIVVTGTDTGIGKTVFAAGLTGFLGARYWKPVQAGLDEATDSETVMRLGVPASHILPEGYRLQMPASPHRAAAAEGITIDPSKLALPSGPVVIEGAGGLMVPLTRRLTYLDVFADWGLPVILCARTALGTINHTLLSVEALRRCNVPILGVAFIGESQPDSESIIAELGQVPVLGRLPWMTKLDAESLRAEFDRGFGRALTALQPASAAVG